jgi:RNA polymerase sigma-70 factor (ECF subfamily)
MQPVSDEDLVAQYRASAGRCEAESLWNELFRRHHGRVALWCLRLTGDRESAVDLAQEVFLKAFRYLDSYRGESKFSTWLYSIARNHCFNEVKARAAKPENAGEPLPAALVDTAPDAYTKLERRDAAQMLRELVRDSLSEVEARVIMLHYAEELPLTAVTRLLNLDNISGAKAYSVSARRKLSRAVAGWKPVTQR